MSIPAPAAPSLDFIFDIEANERLLVLALNEAGIFDVDPERSLDEQKTPRVETQFHVGACIARTKVPQGSTDSRQALPTLWNISVVFHVCTDRLVPAQQEAHSLYRARVRRCAAQFFTILNTRMPYHIFDKMLEAGTQPNLETTSGRTEDVSRITFAGVIAVRDTAWPVGF